MLSATLLNANLVTDMPTNPANLVTDMPANTAVVHLHAKMQAFCNITQCKPCNRRAHKPYKPCNRRVPTIHLFTCTQKNRLSATLLNVNRVTYMPTNPTVVHLHAKMHAFCNSTQCKPCNRHAYKPYQLFTCTQKCITSITIPMANLGTDMFTNPTVIQLHVKMQAFCNITQCKPCNIHAYKPYSCSAARKNACFLRQYSMQTL